MNYRNISGIALLLAAAMTLSACASTAAYEGGPQEEQNSVQAADISQEERNTVQAAAALPTAVQTDVDLTDSSPAFSDAFSNRDLAGTYDAANAVRITLNGSAISRDSETVTVSGSTATITAAGTYLLSGTLEDGTIIVDAGKEDKVQLVLDNISIHSDTFAAIYIRQADKVFLTLADGTVNTLSNGGIFGAIDNNNVDGVIFSKDDLTLNGTGKLVVTSPGKHGIVSKDDLVITSGTYEITADSHALSGKDSVAIADGIFTLAAGKDGIHAENGDDDTLGGLYIAGGTFAVKAGDDGVHANSLLQIDGGSLEITAPEGMEGTYIRINDGTVNIYASDDGINAARKSGAYTPTIEINGGEVTVEVGPGDTDCIDSNGNLIITGGVISVTGNSTFDCDGSVTFTGGTVIVNGQQVDTIPIQRMGGRGGMDRNFGGGQNGNWNPGDGRTMPDGNGENGSRGQGGKGGRGRFFDENGSNGNMDSGKLPAGPADRGGGGRGSGFGPGLEKSKIPDSITSPTRTIETV